MQQLEYYYDDSTTHGKSPTLLYQKYEYLHMYVYLSRGAVT